MSNMSVNKNPYAKNASQETSRGKKLGEAGSTGGGYDAAIVVFNYYQKDVARGPSMDEITIKYIEDVVTDGQRAELKKKDLTEQQLTNIADAISFECMAKMFSYDGKGDPNSTKARAKPTYLGLGARVANYKREHQLTELKKPGTPPGNRSLRSMFAFVGNS